MSPRHTADEIVEIIRRKLPGYIVHSVSVEDDGGVYLWRAVLFDRATKRDCADVTVSDSWADPDVYWRPMQTDHSPDEIYQIIHRAHPDLGVRGLHHTDPDVPVWSAVLFDPHLPEGQDEMGEVAVEDHDPVVYTSWY